MRISALASAVARRNSKRVRRSVRPIETLEGRVLLSGDGLSATYYDGANLTAAMNVTGTPYTEIVANLAATNATNGLWGTGKPAVMTTGDADTWSARFTGAVHAPETGTYTFRTYADNGVRLWVDGVQIINRWDNQWNVYNTGNITLEAGRKYQIRLEFFENTGGALCRLEWRRPSMASGVYEVIPQQYLYSEQHAFPTALNRVNVKDFGAVGDGIADDWKAIQSAISSIAGNPAGKTSTVVYLPNGTYKVSRQLEWRVYKTDPNDPNNIVPDTAWNGGWRGYIILQGQSRGNTIIKLADNTYTTAPSESPTAWSPNAVLYTASQDYTGSGAAYSDVNGEGNLAFFNSIRDLSVHVGAGNTGAVGISYQVSNEGTIRNVNILSESGAGFAGIRMWRKDNGPGTIRDVLVTGFDYAFSGPRGTNIYSCVNIEHMTIRNQNVAGFQNEGQVISIRDLQSNNSVPGFVNAGAFGSISIIDSNLKGGAASNTAIQNPGGSGLFVRNVQVSGYGTSISSTVSGTTTNLTGNITEFVSHPVRKNFSDAASTSLNLPVEEFPEYVNNNLNDWAYVGNPSGGDDAAAIQAAMNSGKPIVYFKGYATYRIGSTITVPATVRKIVFDYAFLTTPSTHIFGDAANPKPVFKITGTTSDAVIFETPRLRINTAGSQGFQHDSARPLAIRGIESSAVWGYVPTSNAGKVFLEDVIISNLTFQRGQKVWTRGLNIEGDSNVQVTNNGADLWIFGGKLEKPKTAVATALQGRTEVLGMLLFPNFKGAAPDATSLPAFTNDRGYVSLTYGSLAYPTSSYDYYTHVRESRDGTTWNSLLATSLTGRGSGRNMQLYRGGSTTVLTDTSKFADATSGGSLTEFADSQAYGGTCASYSAGGVGGFITYGVTGVPAGNYSLKVTFKKRPTSPIIQGAVSTSLEGTYTNVGGTQDLYTSSATYQRLTFGNVTMGSNGTLYVRITAVGQNASSTGWAIQIDKIELVPV